MEWFVERVAWMQWSVPSAIFFLALFVTIVGMSLWEGKVPSLARKGFLPVETTRGERLFLGIISTIGIFLIWIALLAGALLIVPIIVAAVWFFVVCRWG